MTKNVLKQLMNKLEPLSKRDLQVIKNIVEEYTGEEDRVRMISDITTYLVKVEYTDVEPEEVFVDDLENAKLDKPKELCIGSHLQYKL